jgi:hypothetical protein
MSKKDGRKAGPLDPVSGRASKKEFDHASLAAPWIQERINLAEDASIGTFS